MPEPGGCSRGTVVARSSRAHELAAHLQVANNEAHQEKRRATAAQMRVDFLEQARVEDAEKVAQEAARIQDHLREIPIYRVHSPSASQAAHGRALGQCRRAPTGVPPNPSTGTPVSWQYNKEARRTPRLCADMVTACGLSASIVQGLCQVLDGAARESLNAMVFVGLAGGLGAALRGASGACLAPRPSLAIRG